MGKKSKHRQKLAAAQPDHELSSQDIIIPEVKSGGLPFVGQTLLELLEREDPNIAPSGPADRAISLMQDSRLVIDSAGVLNVQQWNSQTKVKNMPAKPTPPTDKRTKNKARKERARDRKKAAAARSKEEQNSRPDDLTSDREANGPEANGVVDPQSLPVHRGNPQTQAAPHSCQNTNKVVQPTPGFPLRNNASYTYESQWSANQHIMDNLANLLGYNSGWNGYQQPTQGVVEAETPYRHYPPQNNPQSSSGPAWKAQGQEFMQQIHHSWPFNQDNQYLAARSYNLYPFGIQNFGSPQVHQAQHSMNPFSRGYHESALLRMTEQTSQAPRQPKAMHAPASQPTPQPSAEYLAQANQEPTKASEPQRLLVVIDLNGTLVHRIKSRQTFKSRTDLPEFLQYLFTHFSVMVWSSARPGNVSRVCDVIFTLEQRRMLRAEWARDMLGLTPAQYEGKVQVYKQLGKIWEMGERAKWHPKHDSGKRYGPHNTILLDDSILKASSEPFNLVQVPELEKAKEPANLRVLKQVATYLEELKWYENVSAFIKSNPFRIDDRWNSGEPFTGGR